MSSTHLDYLQVDNLSSSERTALTEYKAASDLNGVGTCFEMNAELRSGVYVQELGTADRQRAEDLDRVFSRCPRLSHDQTVFRALGTRLHLPLTIEQARFRNGEYWSTSANFGSAVRFLNPVAGKPCRFGAMLRIQLPAGFPAYNMETLDGAGGSEAELLLPRGTLWEVVEKCSSMSGEIDGFTSEHFETIFEFLIKPLSYLPVKKSLLRETD